MAPGVEALRAQLEPFFLARGEARLAHALGGPLVLRPLVEHYRALFSPDAYLAVMDAAQAAGGNELAAPLGLLRRFLAHEGARLRAARAEVDASTLWETAVVHVENRALPAAEAWAELSAAPRRERREALSAALGQLFERQAAPFVAQHDALQRTAEKLSPGSAGVPGFLESLDGVPLAALADAAGALLAQTEDGHRELLAYVLHKVDARLEPRRARWHDVLHAAPARWLGILRREELLPLVDRWLDEQGLPLHGHGRVERLARAHAGGPGLAHALALRTPRDVKLVHALGGGMADAASLFHAHGQAVSLSHRSPSLPAELRLLDDGAAAVAVGAAFERVLVDERWLRRYLGLSAPAARDAARVAAFGQLLALRRSCARLQWVVRLHQQGTLEHAPDGYEEMLGRAWGVGVERGCWPLALPRAHEEADALRGAALEAALAQTLREQFGEDHWRNPAAGARWRVMLGTGLGPLLARDAGGLPAAGARLLAVLDA